MASDLLLFQISSVSALIGMTLGWRGVMTRYSGFYDLPTAWSNIFWGILLGGIYGSMIYTEIIIPTIEFEATGGGEIANPINLVLLCLIASIVAHFILRRKRVRSGSSQTTSGWALGLAIGGMFGMVVIYAVLRLSDFNTQLDSVDKLSKETLEPIVHELIKSNDTNFKGVGQPLRIALTGSKFGPGIYDIIISLGKEEVTKRLTNKKLG